MENVTPEEGRAARDAIFREHLDKHKIDSDYLAKKLKSELNAKEVKTFKGSDKEFDEHGKLSNITETVIYSKPMIAWDVRQKARMDAHKLRGDYPAEKHELSGRDGKPIEHSITIEAGEAVSKILERLTADLHGPPTNGDSVSRVGKE